jgi:primosomal protein N' (replication factor Y) (superfamily II helicase)
MNVVDVIPFSRTLGRETLTYFTSKKVSPGAIVTVPLRNKDVAALVVSSSDALLSKADLKHSPHKFKKVKSVISQNFLLPSFIEAAGRTAEYHACTTGAILGSLVPQKILTAYSDKTIDAETCNAMQFEKIASERPAEKFVFQAPEEERMATYKSLIREEFARGHSIFFCFPTSFEVEQANAIFTRGISAYVYTLHNELNKKTLIENWNIMRKESHNVLIIGTPQFLSVPRGDIRTVVLEHERSSSYFTMRRPHIDSRVFAGFFSELQGARHIMGDAPLRTETLYRKERGEYLEFAPLNSRVLSPAQHTVLDMNEYQKKRAGHKYSMISSDLEELIEDARQSHERVFVFAPRKGLHPTTVCNDCGTTVICKQCESPLVLHKKKAGPKSHSGEQNIFLCHKCTTLQPVTDKCTNCDSWRLKPLGVGTESVEEEIRGLAPHMMVFRLDKENAPTKKKVMAIMDGFHEAPSAVLVGTELALPYLKKTAHVVVASIDSLFTIPDFRMHERIFGLLLKMREKAGKNFLIQTRMKDSPVFEHTVRGNLLYFYRDEIALREQLNYPPITTLIKVTCLGAKEKSRDDIIKCQTIFEEYSPDIYPAFISKIQGKYAWNMLIRLKEGEWPNEKLRILLMSLPMSFEVRINPESIL